jgi:hypothetical protein
MSPNNNNKAVMLVNKYYVSQVFIFTKRRFSDYAAQQTLHDQAVSFVEVGGCGFEYCRDQAKTFELCNTYYYTHILLSPAC